jgi:hypothetical protein
MGQALTEDVHVKFSREDLAILEDVCRQRAESVSAFIRLATYARLARLDLLPPARRKALGITETEDPEVGTTHPRPCLSGSRARF